MLILTVGIFTTERSLRQRGFARMCFLSEPIYQGEREAEETVFCIRLNQRAARTFSLSAKVS